MLFKEIERATHKNRRYQQHDVSSPLGNVVGGGSLGEVVAVEGSEELVDVG